MALPPGREARLPASLSPTATKPPLRTCAQTQRLLARTTTALARRTAPAKRLRRSYARIVRIASQLVKHRILGLVCLLLGVSSTICKLKLLLAMIFLSSPTANGCRPLQRLSKPIGTVEEPVRQKLRIYQSQAACIVIIARVTAQRELSVIAKSLFPPLNIRPPT